MSFSPVWLSGDSLGWSCGSGPVVSVDPFTCTQYYSHHCHSGWDNIQTEKFKWWININIPVSSQRVDPGRCLDITCFCFFASKLDLLKFVWLKRSFICLRQTPSRTVGAVQVQVWWSLKVGSELWTFVLSSVSTWYTVFTRPVSVWTSRIRQSDTPADQNQTEKRNTGQTLRFWDRKCFQGAQWMVLIRLMSSESCSRTFLSFSTKMSSWFFWSCGSDRVYIEASDRFEKYSYLSRIYSKHEQNRRSFRRLTGCVSVVSGPVLSPHRLVNWIRTHLWHSGAEKVPQPRLHRWTLLSDCLWRRFIY